MKILMLGPQRQNLIDYLGSFGDEVVTTEEKINPNSTILENVIFIVSYGYSYIIKRDVLNLLPNKVINLHISLLPWNRGADPNLWSFLDDTPKGVTIHYVDEGLDTGRILAQERVDYRHDDTLRSTYDRLSKNIEKLFMKVWPDIREGRQSARIQPRGGSQHALRDRMGIEYSLTQGWDTPISQLIGKAK